MKRTVLAPLAITLAGCVVGPTYRAPEADVPAAWSAPAGDGAELARWWAVFDDPTLTALVERAASANLELAVAEARIREARALARLASAGPWPAADASAGYSWSERSESASDRGAEDVAGDDGAAGGGRNRDGDLFRAGVDALWEIDLFGGAARAVEAVEADLAAAEEERRATLVRLLGDVAATYVELRGLDAELASTRSNLAAQRETSELTELRRDVGLASDFDLERARAQVAATAADVPSLEGARRVAVHRLGLLVGATPDALADELGDPAPVPRAPDAAAIGVPADLLRRRPDVRAAERALAAATARIGEAEADLYPRLTLTGSIGLRSEQIADLVSGKSLASTVGPSLVWPVFDAGRIRANVDVQDARRAQALARWEAAVLGALEEVESAHARWQQERVRRAELRLAAAANREAAALATELWANGLADFLEVLDAERSRLESERLLVRSEAAVATHLAALYVALGGGWEEAAR